VFWLFWLSCQYLSNDWLERLLRKPNRGEGIISTKPKSAHDFLGLLYCFIVFVICLYCPRLKVPLNINKPNQTLRALIYMSDVLFSLWLFVLFSHVMHLSASVYVC